MTPMEADQVGDGRRGRPGDRDRAGARGGIRAGGLPRRADRAALQAVRADACRVGDPVGDLRVDLHAGDVRVVAACRWRRPTRGTGRSAGSSPSSTALFERSRDGYISTVSVMVRHAVIVMLTFAALLVAVWGLIEHAPDRPRAAGGPRLRARRREPAAGGGARAYQRRHVGSSPASRASFAGVDGVVYISGFNLLTGQAVSYNGTAFRPAQALGAAQELLRVGRQPRAHADGAAQRRDQGRQRAGAQPAAHPRPQHGRRLHLRAAESRRRRTPRSLSQVLQGLLDRGAQAPRDRLRVQRLRSAHPADRVQVDRDKVKSLGIQLNDVFFTLQTFLGSYYVNDFNLFGRTYRVQAQADGAQRSQPDDVNRFYVRSDDGTMVPLVHAGEQPADQWPAVLRALQRLQRSHHQWNERAGLQLGPGDRRDGGARPRTARRVSPTNGAKPPTRKRRPAARPATSSRCRCCSCILVLAALYESWAMPVAILLVIPFGVFGAFLGPAARDWTTTSTRRSASSC